MSLRVRTPDVSELRMIQVLEDPVCWVEGCWAGAFPGSQNGGAAEEPALWLHNCSTLLSTWKDFLLGLQRFTCDETEDALCYFLLHIELPIL